MMYSQSEAEPSRPCMRMTEVFTIGEKDEAWHTFAYSTHPISAVITIVILTEFQHRKGVSHGRHTHLT